jgi:hypothetical protein
MKNGIAAFFGPVLAASLIALVSGCGDGRPERAPVRGKVTMNGQPVPLGTIQFWPEEGRPARGTINKDGTYTLTTFEQGDGAILGKHTVTIEATMTADNAPKPKSIEEEISIYSDPNTRDIGGTVSRTLIPPGYADRTKTPLSAEVKPGENTFDFPLKPKL